MYNLVKIPSARGTLLAVLDYYGGRVHVVDLGALFDDEGQLRENDAVVELNTTFSSPKNSCPYPYYVSLGESDDEVLVSTFHIVSIVFASRRRATNRPATACLYSWMQGMMMPLIFLDASLSSARRASSWWSPA